VLAAGHRTKDLAAKGQPVVATKEMGELVAKGIRATKLALQQN
jgi:hypothetical protein